MYRYSFLEILLVFIIFLLCAISAIGINELYERYKTTGTLDPMCRCEEMNCMDRSDQFSFEENIELMDMRG